MKRVDKAVVSPYGGAVHDALKLKPGLDCVERDEQRRRHGAGERAARHLPENKAAGRWRHRCVSALAAAAVRGVGPAVAAALIWTHASS